MTAMRIPAALPPSQADRDREHHRHDHRLDLSPEMVAADPDPAALWHDLCATYGEDSAATLFAVAVDLNLPGQRAA